VDDDGIDDYIDDIGGGTSSRKASSRKASSRIEDDAIQSEEDIPAQGANAIQDDVSEEDFSVSLT